MSPSNSGSFQLRDSFVDVWKVDLTSPGESLARWLEVLSADETQRAASIGSESMRKTFVLARIALRLLLGRYLDSEPRKVQIACDVRGKPAVSGHPDMCFSASRSGSIAAFAFCLNTPIGIDIEALCVVPKMNRVIERMFSACEKRDLALFTPADLERAFLACWTRKEAYAKAVGEGILASFDSFCVDVNPDEPRPGIHFHGALSITDTWFMRDLHLGDQHVAALACRNVEPTISIFEAKSVEALLRANSR